MAHQNALDVEQAVKRSCVRGEEGGEVQVAAAQDSDPSLVEE